MGRERIVILSAFYEPFVSGAERMVVEVAERLGGRFDVVVLTARLDRKLPRRETKKAGAGAYEIRRVGLGFAFDKFLYPLLAPGAARRLRPDVVHAVMESYAGLALWFYAWRYGRHGTILTLQSGDLDLPEKNRRIPRLVWRNIHAVPERVVGISAALAARARTLGAADVRVIPNGVDLAHLDRIARQPKRAHRLVTVARLSPEKGLPHLLEALPEVVGQFPDAEFLLVGGGALAGDLKDRAARLGVGDHVTFAGARPNPEALAMVSSAEVFVLPSLGEGLGIVLIEAQALGVPVVGTRVGGIPDVIEDGVTGLLVPPADPQALAGAVNCLFSDPALARRLAAVATSRLARFDWDRIAEAYAELYRLAS
jgi:glycosyltransferase involved in cell wall biosynthesis